jgi:hypothetical protein
MIFQRNILGGVILAVLMVGASVALAQQGVTNTAADCLAAPHSSGCMAGLPATQYQMLLDDMLMHPHANVEQVPPNESEITRFAFRQIRNAAAIAIYDAPAGNAIGTLDAGYNFVTVQGYQDGWVEINAGQWVAESDTIVARPSEFSGVVIDEIGLDYPMAWVLLPVRPAPYPGAEEDPERPRIERYTLVNIFAHAEVDGWEWYLVGPDTWIIQTKIARIEYVDRPEGIKGRWVSVDLYEQVLVAYEEDGRPIFATLISSGLPQWSTNEGTFQTWARLATGNMTGAVGQNDFYSLENVPWTLYFDDEIALHGAYWHDGFGYRRSHGCVNLSITDSHWLFQWTSEGGFDYPFVYVFSSGEYRGEQDQR